MNESISEVDIRKALGRKAKIVSYRQLSRIKNIDKQLAKTPFIFVLYEYRKNYGHWVLILKTNGRVEFFDPYSSKPDAMLGEFTKNVRSRFGMNFPVLAKLLYESKYPIEFNDYKLQRRAEGVQTCGKWDIVRALFSAFNIDEFADVFVNKGKSPDRLIVEMYDRLVKRK